MLQWTGPRTELAVVAQAAHCQSDRGWVLLETRLHQWGSEDQRPPWKSRDSYGYTSWTPVTDPRHGGNEWKWYPRAVTEWCVVWEGVWTKQACVQQPSGSVSQGGEAARPTSPDLNGDGAWRLSLPPPVWRRSQEMMVRTFCECQLAIWNLPQKALHILLVFVERVLHVL